MCGIDPRQQQLQTELLGVGINLLSKLVEAELGANTPQCEDVLSVATKAYQQGAVKSSCLQKGDRLPGTIGIVVDVYCPYGQKDYLALVNKSMILKIVSFVFYLKG